MEIIEGLDDWRERYARWKLTNVVRDEDVGANYPWVVNRYAPFVPARRALPMLNLALISSAGAYIDGTEPFDTSIAGGDVSFREIPLEVEAEDLRWSARGYDPQAVREDMNAQVPIARLQEFEGNGIIGQLNPVWWSFCGFIPSAGRFTQAALPQLVERVVRYEAQAALLIPASRLCHQTMALAARALEAARIPTMTLAVEREVMESVRPPRAVFYAGQFGSVAGLPNWPEHQRRILDQALRLIEPTDQVGLQKLVVDLETTVEQQRGER
ncbi:MAG TPA: glycine/sarcosine/betaine reductase selenoprotein B family protein [Pyrinomonadaceae bacterium]|jgi:D-proline reductase (dithiol) PrdB|nr:glycine/sarcosine/betaine reductase selenoprotein B family protein [Pyrinomonadaceae bacterium]